MAAAQVLLARELLITLQGATKGGAELSGILPVLGFFVLLSTISRFCAAVQNKQSELLQELVTNKTRRQVMEAAGQIDLITFENSSFRDRLQRASQTAGFRSLEMIQSIVTLLGLTTRILGIAIE